MHGLWLPIQWNIPFPYVRVFLWRFLRWRCLHAFYASPVLSSQTQDMQCRYYITCHKRADCQQYDLYIPSFGKIIRFQYSRSNERASSSFAYIYKRITQRTGVRLWFWPPVHRDGEIRCQAHVQEVYRIQSRSGCCRWTYHRHWEPWRQCECPFPLAGHAWKNFHKTWKERHPYSSCTYGLRLLFGRDCGHGKGPLRPFLYTRQQMFGLLWRNVHSQRMEDRGNQQDRVRTELDSRRKMEGQTLQARRSKTKRTDNRQEI